jgi:hypothetical protein
MTRCRPVILGFEQRVNGESKPLGIGVGRSHPVPWSYSACSCPHAGGSDEGADRQASTLDADVEAVP